MAGEFDGLERLAFENGEVVLHAVAAGPRDGPVVLLLHGFPEFWYGWRRQILPLARAGFRVIAPDQRGYNLSTKPRPVRAYTLPKLTSDVLAIADQVGCQKIFLGGHDWGAAVAWNTAILHPDRIAKLAILNVPHPAVMIRYLRTRPAQMLRSWYMLFFQIPKVPEFVFSANNFRVGIRALERSSRPGTFSPNELERYREAWSQPGAMRGMIHWYRTLSRSRPTPLPGKVQVPALILWGVRDKFLMAEMARESVYECSAAKLICFEDATHWLHHEEPERVTALLAEFFCSVCH
ncbi:MAG: alpha/beta fold hydrolase [Acidobacteriaceae bacterium]|nr:alpha/beta fold hydrolase [Acidobacteriaceae bacterium]